jgi:hypothetical protein
MLLSSLVSALAAAGWWWVTWPKRTADTFVRLMNENKWDEASHLFTTARGQDAILQLGQELQRAQEGLYRPKADHYFRVLSIDRSWTDLCLGRQAFWFGIDTGAYVVQRGRVVLPFE